MSIALRLRGEVTINGNPLDDVPPEGADIGEPPIVIEGEDKSCEIENQSAVAVHMTLGDLDDGGSEMEIPAGATVTVSGPHTIKLEASHA